MISQYLHQNQRGATAKVLVTGPEKNDQMQAALVGSWLALLLTPWMCRATLCVYHPCCRTVMCCFAKPHVARWVWRTLSCTEGELLVGTDCCIFHSSSLMAEVCAVSLLAVSCKLLLNISMVSHLKTLKCIPHFLLSFKNQRTLSYLMRTMNAVSQKLSCIRWAVHVLTSQDIQMHL